MIYAFQLRSDTRILMRCFIGSVTQLMERMQYQRKYVTV